MVFEASADDLPLVVQILRPDETNDAVDEKRLEGARDSVSSRFKRQLIDSVMRLGRERAALARLEVHRVVPDPADIGIALTMMIQNLFAPLAQHTQSDSETAIGRFRARDGLEKKIDRRAAL